MPVPRNPDSLEAHGIDLHALFVRAVDSTRTWRYAIARELGVSETILSRCYTGKRPPSLELLCDVGGAASGDRAKETTNAKGLTRRNQA